MESSMPNLNVNCCGDQCRTAHSEVRLYPLGGGANLILCHACWAHENRYRYHRQADYVRKAQRDSRLPVGRGRDAARDEAQTYAAQSWPQLNWHEAEVYST